MDPLCLKNHVLLRPIQTAKMRGIKPEVQLEITIRPSENGKICKNWKVFIKEIGKFNSGVLLMAE